MKRALAFLFQREGSPVSEDDFVYTQSVDLEWFSSDEARILIEKANSDGLIKIDGEMIEADFDYENIEIPIGFEPSKDILEEEKEDIFSELLSDLVENSGLSKQKVMSKVNDLQDSLNVEITTAMLLFARKRDIPLTDMERKIDKVSRRIRGKQK
ncbi:MAG: DUF2240 family protein [Thermoplasmata archaeon]